jgi:hypothetical protein
LIWTASCPCRLLAPSSFSDKHQQPPVSVPNVHSVFGAPAINSSAARVQLPAAVPTSAGLSAYQRAHRRSSDDNLTITSELKEPLTNKQAGRAATLRYPIYQKPPSPPPFDSVTSRQHPSSDPLSRNSRPLDITHTVQDGSGAIKSKQANNQEHTPVLPTSTANSFGSKHATTRAHTLLDSRLRSSVQFLAQPIQSRQKSPFANNHRRH